MAQPVRRQRAKRIKMKCLIVGVLVVSATIVLVVAAVIRHESNKQDARWCHDHGYAHYATKDGFCVGASGKLTKVGTNKSHI
jgi:hypothetical protein